MQEKTLPEVFSPVPLLVPQIETGLSEEKIKTLYGDETILLFKGAAPFVEIEKNVPAGVILESKDKKVLCYICKKWFEQLGTHLRVHQIDARAYKKRFGFNRSAPLCSRSFSEKASNAARKSWEKDYESKVESIRSIGLMNYGRPVGAKRTIQDQNRLNTCDEQIKERMRLLVAKFGPDVTINEARTVDGGLVKITFDRFGGWNNFKSSLGLEIDTHSLKKNRANLIYDLRKYVLTHQKSPFRRGVKQEEIGFEHSLQPYLTEFGSLIKAYQICGIKNMGAGKFIAIE